MEDHRRGGGGKNKKRKNKRRRDPRKPPQGSRGPPLTPVLKVTIRKISSAHGDAESVASMIRDLIRSANEKLSVMDPKMVLDEAHLQQLIEDEKVAVAAALQWKEQKEKEVTVNGEAKAEEDAASTAETVDETKAETTEKNTTAGDYLAAAMDKSLQIADGNSLKNQIATRVLYMVPSKKSRRRGERHGIAYLVLTSPPIETLAPVAEPMNCDGCDNTIASSQSTTAAASVTSSSVPPPPPALDYSRDVAKRRLMLQQALVAMQAVAAVDATNNADAMIVEESINAKTWKQYNKMRSSLDRMAGAIFETDDYQQFLEKTVQDEEQRRARPKPAPGGGMTAAAAGTMGSNSGTDASGQPVAALVLHLQKKQEEEKRRKQAKRKAKDSKKKKVGPARSNVPADAGDSGTGGKDANKKRGRRPKKKRGPSNGKYTEISKPSGGG
jgi:hypothetical protein